MNLLPRLSFAFRRRKAAHIAFGVVAFGCVVLTSGAASAQVNWKRVGTVSTLTNGQLCKTDGTNVICDSTTPSISASNFVGIGSTAPVVSLDDSQNPDAIALPGGSNAQRPTGANLVNGEIRYNTNGSGQIEAYYNGAWNSLVTSATAGTSTPAAGSTGYVQFNSGGDLGASSGLTWDNSNAALTITSSANSSASTLNLVGGTAQTTSQPVLSITQTWNNAATTFDAPIFVNVTDTASNGTAGSRAKLLDLQKGGASQFWIDKYGGFEAGLNSMYLDGYSGNFWLPGSLGITFTTNMVAMYNSTAATHITGNKTATLQIGAQDAAAPVAQTLTAQSVVAGTTNTAGQNFTIAGSQGTGTGAGGAIVFQTAPVGTSGTAQNAAAERMRITGAGNIGIGTTSPGAFLDIEGTTGTTGDAIRITSSAGNYNAIGNYNTNELYIQPHTLFEVLRGYSYTSGQRKMNAADIVMAVGNHAVSFGSSSASGSPYQMFLSDSVNSGSGRPAIVGNWSASTDYWGIGGNSASSLDRTIRIGTVSGTNQDWNNGTLNFVVPNGSVGIGTTSPAGTLDVEGGTASSGNGTNVKVYAQNGQASGNTNGGNIVLMPGTANGTGAAGAVGIGSATPATGMKADIAGPVKVAGTGSEPCTAAQVGAIRYNPTGNYFELCSYP